MASPPDPFDRPRASVIGSVIEGWSRALHAPWVAGMLVLALFTLVQSDHIAFGHYGSILAEPMPWRDEIKFALGDISMGFLQGHVLLDLLIAFPPSVSSIAYAAMYFAVTAFFMGGIVDRLARGRPVRAPVFSWACGYNFGRLARLGVAVALVQWLLSGLLRRTFSGSASLAPLLITTCLVELVAGFAAVRLVVEDRRSTFGGLAAAMRFMRRRPLRVAALYTINQAVLVILIAAWPRISTLPLLSTGELSTGLFFLADTWTRLALVASQIVFFQRELAHAHYTAAPTPRWPDSPAVEAIENLARNARSSGGDR